jgi:thiol:disulfide interchange protein DsbC
MKKLLCLLSVLSLSVYGQVPTNIENQIKKMLPNTKITQINYGPFSGTYEVIAGTNAFYVGNGNESEVIVGHIVNFKSMQDVTQSRIELVNQKQYSFEGLPLNLALKVGTGKKRMAVFIDPDCPYCQQLEAFLSDKLDKLTIYYFFMPLSIHPNALTHTQQILCADNPAKAINQIMISHDETLITSNDCIKKVENQISATAKYAQENGINATPYIITDSNKAIGGFDIKELQTFIKDAK